MQAQHGQANSEVLGQKGAWFDLNIQHLCWVRHKLSCAGELPGDLVQIRLWICRSRVGLKACIPNTLGGGVGGCRYFWSIDLTSSSSSSSQDAGLAWPLAPHPHSSSPTHTTRIKKQRVSCEKLRSLQGLFWIGVCGVLALSEAGPSPAGLQEDRTEQLLEFCSCHPQPSPHHLVANSTSAPPAKT